jgi:hypothetical protein
VQLCSGEPEIAAGPAILIGSNAIAHKTEEGAMDPKEKKRESNLPYAIPWIGNINGELIADTKLINETVEWLATEVKRRGALKHHDAAEAIIERLGLQAAMGGLVLMTRERDDGDGSIREVYRFSPPVLQALRKRTGKTVRWGKHDRYWVAVGPKQARSA